MSEKLSQVEAVRVMWAAQRWVWAEKALVDAGLTKPMGTPVDFRAVKMGAADAEQKFADLIASLTESEGL